MTRVRTLAVVALLLALAVPARADGTVFIGANTTPANRMVKGFAVSLALLAVAFELEYATTGDDLLAGAPSFKTGMGNLLLQSPFPLFGFQPYFTTGGGLYREELGTHRDTSVGLNTGGGVKVALLGPVQLRVDYRVFKLGSGALNSPAHRVYLGLNLKF